MIDADWFARMTLVWLVISVAFACEMQTPTNAQTPDHAATWLTRNVINEHDRGTVSKPGAMIVSFPCDPMMNAQQERALIDALGAESEITHDPEVRLTEIVRTLRKRMPIRIDQRALEEIGIEMDAIAGATIEYDEPNSDSDSDSDLTSQAKPRWWQSSDATLTQMVTTRPHHQIRRPTIAVDLLNRLRDLDLTIMINRGYVTITTRESAEEDLATRVYDVTPLTSPNRNAGWQGGYHDYAPDQTNTSRLGTHEIERLIETTVDQSSWEAWGGNSTLSSMQVRGRHWLVIATFTPTHWKIQRLLDRLNQ